MPTVAGPIIVTPFSFAFLFNFLVIASGIPSAIMAIHLIYKKPKITYSFAF